MKTSEQLNEIGTALSIAQGAFTFANKEGKSHHGKYAKLENVWQAIRPHLMNNGLSIIQSPSFTDGRVCLTTRLLHKSGQWIESELSMRPVRDDAHSVGSAITYLRRYSLSPIIGSVDSEDDDGNAAMGKNKDTGKQETGEFEEKILGNEPQQPPYDPLNEASIYLHRPEQQKLVVDAVKSIGGSKDRVVALCKAYKERGSTMKDVVADLKAITDVEIPF